MIYGERVKQAREFKGLTQTQLANMVGIQQSAISQIEKNDLAPSVGILQAIAECTGFLPSFFELEIIGNLPVGTLNYRAKRSLRASEEAQAYQYANILYQQIRKITLGLPLPPMRIPRLSNINSFKAAQITRDTLGFSREEPIKRLLQGLEDGGVVIFSLPRVMPNIDAFSTWAELDELRPLIIMIPGKPMDRLRFSIAHELGHSVMHHKLLKNFKLLECEANDFASELLMPEQAMLNEITVPVTLSSLARLKVRWGVSMQALIMRARSLKIITIRQAKYLFTQMSSQGWRTKEPSNLDIRPELPKTVRSLIETKYRTSEDYALDMGMEKDTAIELYVHT